MFKYVESEYLKFSFNLTLEYNLKLKEIIKFGLVPIRIKPNFSTNRY